MTFPTLPPPPDTRRPEAPRRTDRFFTWVAGLGLARSDGWIGGVAAGIASRLRIDPLIVRGVLVVTAVFGLPMIFLYAAAWALLPDPEGRIHLRELLRSRFEPAQLGILAGLLVGMLTVTPTAGLFLVERIFNPYSFHAYGVSGFGVFLFIVGLVLVGILLILIVRAARRTPGDHSSDPRMASAMPTLPRPSAPAGLSGAVAAAETREEDAAADTAMPASSFVSEPTMPTDPDQLESWRAQHAAWKEQDQTWRQQQQDAERAARDQARQERQTTAAAFAAEAAERRRVRRTSNPRASFAYVTTVIGVALVAATVVWLWSQNPDATTAGMALFTAALVLAFGMIVAGVSRRRSGFLAFVSAATLIAGLITGGAASQGDVTFGSASISNLDGGTARQPFGFLYVNLVSPGGGDDSHPIRVQKGTGTTQIAVNSGTELQLTATVGETSVHWTKLIVHEDGIIEDGGSGSWRGTADAGDTRTVRESVTSPVLPGEDARPLVSVPVIVEQDSGDVHITYYVPADEEKSE